MALKITSYSSSPENLTLTIDGNDLSFSWLWLRDHCQCSECYHQEAKQRLFDTFNRTTMIESASRVEIEQDGSSLCLSWPSEAHTVRYTASFLSAVINAQNSYNVCDSVDHTWNSEAAAGKLNRIDFEDLLGDDASLSELLSSIQQYGIVSIRKVPLSHYGSRAVMERIGWLRSGIFGELWDLKADGDLADTGCSNLAIEPHTDGTYNHDAPGLLGLHCIDFDAVGGDNILVDGALIAEKLRKQFPVEFSTLCTSSVVGQYIGDGAHLVASRPAIRYQREHLIQISYNNHDRAPFWLPEPAMSELYQALSVLDALVHNPVNQFRVAQRPGDMIVFNNWRILHGRHAFEGRRHVIGSYMSREDFEGRIRALNSVPTDMISLSVDAN